ncbi:MAG TPA: hypothetical protein VGK73_22625, partial [Polyangiaceae bacterium]
MTAPFGPAVPAFTAPGLFDGLTFSTDGLTAYLSARPNSTSAHDIFVATRTAVAHAFEIPGVVTSVSGTSEDRAPSLTSDGLRLYVARLNGNSL